MFEGDRFGMEGQSSKLVAGLSIFSVADNGMSLIGQMDADLVFPAGQKGNFQQTESGGFFQHFISGSREFAFCGVGGGINDEGLVLSEERGDDCLFLGQAAVNDRKVFLFRIFPLSLELEFNFLAFCKDKDAGGPLVKTVDGEEPISRF